MSQPFFILKSDKFVLTLGAALSSFSFLSDLGPVNMQKNNISNLFTALGPICQHQKMFQSPFFSVSFHPTTKFGPIQQPTLYLYFAPTQVHHLH